MAVILSSAPLAVKILVGAGVLGLVGGLIDAR
jgi:hypothetical protein